MVMVSNLSEDKWEKKEAKNRKAICIEYTKQFSMKTSICSWSILIGIGNSSDTYSNVFCL